MQLKKHFFVIFIASLSVFSACNKNDISHEIKSGCRSGINPVKKVLFIGIDGCRTDALLAANTPAFDSLMAHGYVHQETDRGPHTVSVPGWSSLLHGVWPEKHGLTSNSFRRDKYEDYPDVFHYLRAAQPELSLASITHWDDFLRITTEEDYAQITSSDQQARDTLLNLINNCSPDVILLHFDEIDDAGHSSGFDPGNAEYLQSIELNDQYTGEIMQVIQQREQNLGEEWLVIVATDHGGNGTGHGGQDDLDETRFVFLIARLPGISRVDLNTATNTDVMPTILEYLGVAVQESWGLDGKALF